MIVFFFDTLSFDLNGFSSFMVLVTSGSTIYLYFAFVSKTKSKILASKCIVI